MVALSELSDFTDVWDVDRLKTSETAVNATLVSPDTPPAVALTLAVAAIVALLRATFAIPPPVDAVAEVVPVEVKTPWVVVKLTTVPSATLLPFVSFTSAVMTVVLVPSAGMLLDPAVTVTVLTAAAMIVTEVDPDAPAVWSADMKAVPGVLDTV